MNNRLTRFSRKYTAALRKFLVREEEVILEEAYELGRKAIAAGLGVLDMAKAHQESLQALLGHSANLDANLRMMHAAETFFMETLSPFEATHRGFREANARLEQLNDALANRNQQLATTNRELELEINERRRVEKALRESEEHYRQLFEEARRMEENLRRLSNQIITAQEEERKRISRDLHDELGQAMTAVNMVLAMLRNEVREETVQKKIASTQSLIVQSMETMHRFARELRPAMIDDLGIVPALRSYIRSFSERTGIKLTFNAHPSVESLDSTQKTVLYRVAQESLNNVAKHAQATRVDFSIRRRTDGVEMEIADNGRAFSVTRIVGKKRLGLLGMQERVRLVNGEFDLESVIGKGTTVRVLIPVKNGSRMLSQANN